MRELSNITANIMTQIKSLQDLAEQIERLEDRIIDMAGNHGETGRNLRYEAELPAVKSLGEPCDIEMYNEGTAGDRRNRFSDSATLSTAIGGPPNIIPFPKPGLFTTRSFRAEPCHSRKGQFLNTIPLLAGPGKYLPSDIPDYRPLLQRDGLILLAWDKRNTEMGERFTAYWVTSMGIPRFYASKLHSPEDFFMARPDHKSYAAEDGIEFYGQEAPVYMVHVAPELMMSNPRHGELRLAHIQILKYSGSDVDFDYKYLLTIDKKRDLPLKKNKDEHQQRADA